MKNKITLFFSLILTLNLFASTDTKFYNINSMYGISMRKITSISKDDKGFIWGAPKWEFYELQREIAGYTNFHI